MILNGKKSQNKLKKLSKNGTNHNNIIKYLIFCMQSVFCDKINGKNPEIGSWSEKWGKILNRDISVGGFEKGKVPNQPTIFYGNNK